MTADFWTRAQEGEREYWKGAHARKSEGSPEARKDFWNGYLDVIRRRRPFRPGDRVLDVGCGPAGIITAVEDVCERYGVDPLMDFYRAEYSLLPEIHYSMQMAESLDFSNGHFDVVTCINVLDHTRSPARAWGEFHRVLKPGGYLLFETDAFAGARRFSKAFKRWTRILRRKQEKHPHTFRVSRLMRDATRAGFGIVEKHTRERRKRQVLLMLLRR